MIAIRRHALVLFMLCVTCISHAGTVTARVEPSNVQPGEPFQLILELDENAPAGLPDFHPLAHDFYIRGTAHRASYTFINGHSKASTQWTVTLLPKHAGKITVPAIQIGQARSEPITIDVTGYHANASNTGQNSLPNAQDSALFIKTHASSEAPYLNQEVIYTVKIFHNTNLLDAAYQPPQLPDALVIPMNDNRQYQVIEHGQPYLVEEQKYAFFPQKTGAQILFAPKFQALIYDDIPRRAQAGGQSITLDIKPIPDHISADTWLPARQVLLQDRFDSTNHEFTEGHTLTRHITVQVKGLPAELIPPLHIPNEQAFNVYTERPELSNAIENGHIVGKAHYTVSYLFNQPGTVAIPSLVLPWFDVKSQSLKKASLPEKSFVISASSDTTTSSATPPVHQGLENSQKIAPKPDAPAVKQSITTHIKIFALFVLLVAIGYIISEIKRYAQKNTARAALKQVKKSCLANQPKAARDALLLWAKKTMPKAHILNLDDIASVFHHPPLTQALKELSKALYMPCSTEAPLWSGQALWGALKLALTQKKKRSKTPLQSSVIPPINPV